MEYSPERLWEFLPIGYVTTVAFELPILWLLLSKHHPKKRKLLAGFWLTACTYPIVVLTMPLAIEGQRWVYLLVAEAFAPIAECILFYFAFHDPEQEDSRVTWRDWGAIVVANLISFGVPEYTGLFR